MEDIKMIVKEYLNKLDHEQVNSITVYNSDSNKWQGVDIEDITKEGSKKAYILNENIVTVFIYFNSNGLQDIEITLL